MALYIFRAQFFSTIQLLVYQELCAIIANRTFVKTCGAKKMKYRRFTPASAVTSKRAWHQRLGRTYSTEGDDFSQHSLATIKRRVIAPSSRRTGNAHPTTTEETLRTICHFNAGVIRGRKCRRRAIGSRAILSVVLHSRNGRLRPKRGTRPARTTNRFSRAAETKRRKKETVSPLVSRTRSFILTN